MPALEKAAKKHPPVAAWLSNWCEFAKRASWRSIIDVRAMYPHADAIPLRSGRKIVMVVTCFNVGGNDYRLLTAINYAAQRVTIIDVLTHAEYDKGKWKKGLS